MPRATLTSWINRVGELLRPISAAMGQELLAGDYIQADETPVAVQMHDSRGKNHQVIFLRKRGLDSCFLVEVDGLSTALEALW
jgi:hypothetical protein